MPLYLLMPLLCHSQRWRRPGCKPRRGRFLRRPNALFFLAPHACKLIFFGAAAVAWPRLLPHPFSPARPLHWRVHSTLLFQPPMVFTVPAVGRMPPPSHQTAMPL